MNAKNKILKIPMELIIECSIALNQGNVEAKLMRADETAGIVLVFISYNDDSKLQSQAIENVEILCEQFQNYRYGDSTGELQIQ